ncbi:hypothetical protein GCM10011514_12190 [Emticicia aquatilis]|uniref:Trimeric autotransporter adhesin YadA-like head domain-containing protein n=1 Tax=Emticicia aquatilis TaxID=1537369 RepID=A0A916YKY7_9BACT|nr:hypothetical protein [Emticicia aquatilis]GGD49581.1 hypothetical protein GCM10011514_12190 [Emticicia aquatilis]
MKKIFILLTFLNITSICFAQNSAETVVDGTKPVFRTNGFGTASGFFPKVSILGNSGNTSSTSDIVGVFGFAQNSTVRNYGMYGYANGATSSENIGVYGLGNVFNAKGVGVRGDAASSSVNADFLLGGEFSSIGNSGINGNAILYGVTAKANSTALVSAAYGIQTNTSANVSVSSYGISATTTAMGTGSEFGGFFNTNGTSTGNKYGVTTLVSGTSNVPVRLGLRALVSGPASTEAYGLQTSVDNSGNGTTYGGYFEAKGSGTGTKYGIYSTVSGSGVKYAAILDGLVGIGTTTPNNAGLVVNKLVGNTAAIFGDNTTGVGIDNNWPGISLNGYYNGGRKPIANGYVGGISFDPTTGKLLLYNTATSGTADNTIVGVDRVFIDNQGDVGIGVSDPLATLQVARGTGANGTAAFEGTTNSTHFNYSTTEDTYIRGGKATSKVYINDTGANVAIGNVNPTEKLHVLGNIKASGNVISAGATINNLTVSSSSSFSGSITFNNTISATDGFFSGSLGVGGTLSPDALNIGGLGSVITKIKRTTLTGQQIFGVVNNTCDLNYYNVPGVLVGDNVILNIDSPFSTLTVANVRASATDTVEVKFCNIGNSNTLLLTGLTFRFMYYR